MNDGKESWLEIHDPEITAVDLETVIEERLEMHRTQLPQVHITYPDFGQVALMPSLPESGHFSLYLYHHLRALNELPPPETLPDLAASPALRIPILGRLWQTIRREAHNMVLYYVNRSLQYVQSNHRETLGVLNELTRMVQLQQTEIDRLHDEVQAMKKDHAS